MFKDLIFGCFEKYSLESILAWLNSIKFSKYKGDIILFVYGNKNDIDSRIFNLHSYFNNISVLHKPLPSQPVVVERFKDMSIFLSLTKNNYRFIFSTDPSDVVFQINPSKIASPYYSGSQLIIACSESIIYKNETWGNKNMFDSFPEYYEFMLEKEIFNAGTILGTKEIIKDLFNDIYELSIKSFNSNPDQAAYNILIQTKYYESTYFSRISDGISIQCGTTAWPLRLSQYGNLLLEKPFFYDGIAYSLKGIKVGILHQYNKVPSLHDHIIKRFYTGIQLSRKNRLKDFIMSLFFRVIYSLK